MAKDDWITTKEAAEISGYHVEYIRELIRADRIKAKKWGREWMISRASVLDHIREVKKLGARRGPKLIP
jgi:excisionase family DNA binding protein